MRISPISRGSYRIVTSGVQIPEFGTYGKNIITGPTAKNLDSSLFKNFYFTGSQRIYLQLRAEAFNTTNTPSFYLPAASVPPSLARAIPGRHAIRVNWLFT